MQSGAIANAARSCAEFWAPLVTGEGEPWYARKTLEEPADREECCLFRPGGGLAEAPSEEGGATTADAAAPQ